jgi:Tfp pilus assembly protein PilN
MYTRAINEGWHFVKASNRDINLIAKRRQKWKQKLLIRFVIFVVCSVFFVVLTSFLVSRVLVMDLQQKNEKILQKIHVLDDINSIIKNIKTKESSIKSTNTIFEGIEKKKLDLLPSLDKIAGVIPSNIGITRISINQGRAISIGVLVDSPLEIISLYETLEKSGLFEPFERMNALPLLTNEIEITLGLTLKGV